MPRACAALGIVLAAALLSGCRGAGEEPLPASRPRETDLTRRIDAALASAARLLVSLQHPDGAWRSEVYGVFRDGPALTPHVLGALALLRERQDEAREGFQKGIAYLTDLAGAGGGIDAGSEPLLFPVYTSADAARVCGLAGPAGQARQAQRAWLAYLRGHQLVEALGWQPSDPSYGGWGYAVGLPRRPPPGQPMDSVMEANLSATVYALDALEAAGVPATDPACRNALAFLRRCQNSAEAPGDADARFDDGGFFFMPGDPARNKAGIAGTDRHGRTRFASYGGTTADGLRALLTCGLPAGHPRVLAARKWLERNFAAHTNPGKFAPDREVIRDATYYYYCRSVAHTLARLGAREVRTASGPVAWADALAEELLRRQGTGGAWINRFRDTKEDDPLVSTPSASVALALCRRMIVAR